MENKHFYIQLASVSMISVFILALFHYYTSVGDYTLLGVIGLIFFIVLSMVVFRLAKNLSNSGNLNAYTHLIMYNLMIKLFLSFIIVLVYYYVRKPDDRLFILPYVAIYLIFTIFEAIFLSKQARSN